MCVWAAPLSASLLPWGGTVTGFGAGKSSPAPCGYRRAGLAVSRSRNVIRLRNLPCHLSASCGTSGSSLPVQQQPGLSASCRRDAALSSSFGVSSVGNIGGKSTKI